MNKHCTIGERLIEAREKMGLTLHDISQRTTLPVSRLKNFEKDLIDFQNVDVYDLSCLKVYCHQIGLIYDDLVRDVVLKPIDLAAYQKKKLPSVFDIVNWRKVLVTTLIMGAAFGLMHFIFSEPSQSPQPIQAHYQTLDQFEL